MKTILLASANVLNNISYLSYLKKERDGIKDVLSSAILRREVHAILEPECSFRDLFDKFNTPTYENNINIFHFSGHSNKEEIILHGHGGDLNTVSVSEIATFLKLQKGLDLVFLNSCSSESIGEILLDGTDGHVKAVIETNKSINDFKAAEFAKLVYQGLHAGKCLFDAFNQAIKHHDNSCNFNSDIKEGKRDITGFIKKGDDETFAWKLSFNNKAIVDNWYLVERMSQKFYRPEVTNRILTIFESTEKNKKYHKVYQSLFTGGKETLSYSLEDLLLEDERDNFLNETTNGIIFLTEGFKDFWDKIRKEMKPFLKNMNLILIAWEGDTIKASQIIIDEFSEKELPVFPARQLAVKDLAKGPNLETVFNGLCAKQILQKLYNPYVSAEKILLDEFEHLNFSKQKIPFETGGENSFQFGHYNLVLLEGSKFCAQELLVKKILLYAIPRIDANIKAKIISIDSSIQKTLTCENLYEELSNTLLDVKMKLKEVIIEFVNSKMEEEDLIIILNDMYKSNGDCLSVIKTFWNDLTNGLSSNPKHRLFIFAIHKDCEFPKNHWSIDGFQSNPPLSNVCLLDAVEPLNEIELNTWHANTGKRFQKGNYFHSLIEEENVKTILGEPYMMKAIAQMCHLMKCPQLSSNILEF